MLKQRLSVPEEAAEPPGLAASKLVRPIEAPPFGGGAPEERLSAKFSKRISTLLACAVRGGTRGKVPAMLGSRALTRFSLVAALAVPLVCTAACGGAPKEAHVLPKAGDMPEGGDWTGVYFSPTYGHLHLVKEGSGGERQVAHRQR